MIPEILKRFSRNFAPDGGNRWLLWLSVGIFSATLLLFWQCAAPTVSFHDSGEFAIAAATGGIPHPPGAPTYCLLASAFLRLVIGFTRDAARSTNLFSGLCGAVTITLAAIIAVWWARIARSTLAPNASGGKVSPSPSVFTLAITALIVPAVLLYSPAFVEQSTTTEQYTLQTALEMVVLLLGTALTQKSGSALKLAAGMGLAIGLAIGNHLSQVALIPFGLWAIWEAARKYEKKQWWPSALKLTSAGIGGLLLGLLVFLYVPIRSHANPLLDWGNVETVDRMVWAITRQEWRVRPISASPPGFVGEWFCSYDLPGQIGYAGIVLMIVGLLSLARRKTVFVGWLFALAAPYAAGMLLAHLRQKGIGLNYLREYGVTDWHIPLYSLAAITAGLGGGVLTEILVRRFGRRNGHVTAITLAALLMTTAVYRAAGNSLSHFVAAETFTNDILAPLPAENAVILPSGDNTIFLLLYHAYGGGLHPSAAIGPFMTYSSISPLNVVEDTLHIGNGWGPNQRRHLLEDVTSGAFGHAMVNTPALPKGKLQKARTFLEYSQNHAAAARWLLPAGYFFELMDHPVSDTQVRTAEREWRRRFPSLLAPPGPTINRHEKEARGLMNTSRGGYFMDRKMWPEAAETYELTTAYLPRNAEIWCSLGICYSHLGDVPKAADAYSQSLVEDPDTSVARVNLAILQAKAGNFSDARQLLEEELARHPGSVLAKRNLAAVAQQEAAPGK